MNMKKISSVVVLISCLGLQLFGLAYLVGGSAEMFPTEEREGAVRIMASLLIILPLMAEFVVWRITRKRS